MQRLSTESTSAVQAKAVLALAGGATIQQAAKHVRCHRDTLSRWIREDAKFQADLARAKRDEIEATRAQVSQLTPLAIGKVFEILRQPLKSKTVAPSVQLRAALSVIIGAEVMAEVDRKVMAERVATETSATRARDFLAGELAKLAERNSPQGIVIETHGVSV